MKPPIRLFIASTPVEWLPARVLEFSIRETTSTAVEIVQLHTFNRPIPMPVEVSNRPRTPFSFQRFLIPELCKQYGQALYLDADMQVFHDIEKLWSFPMQGCDLQTVANGNNDRRGQFSVMLLDCEKLGWNIDAIVESLDSGDLNYEQLMYEMRVARKIGRDIPPEWNSLEYYNPDRTALVHYTDMNRQPWISCDNDLESVWVNCLLRAVQNEFISIEEVHREALSGHIRPSLVAQVERRIDTSRLLGKEAARMDKGYIAPYKAFGCGRAALMRVSVMRVSVTIMKYAFRKMARSLLQK